VKGGSARAGERRCRKLAPVLGAAFGMLRAISILVLVALLAVGCKPHENRRLNLTVLAKTPQGERSSRSKETCGSCRVR
jgi:hypothetical protein